MRQNLREFDARYHSVSIITNSETTFGVQCPERNLSLHVIFFSKFARSL